MRAILPIALLLACTAAPEAGDVARATAPLEPATRDSAGVTIHEHPGDALERAPLIALEEPPYQVHTGAVQDANADVSSIVSWVFSGSGDLVGYDHEINSIVIFPASGGNRWTFGTEGSGPGEFRFVTQFAISGDTIFAWDVNNRRLTSILPRTGLIAGERTVPRGSGSFAGRSEDGTLYFVRPDWMPVGATSGISTVPVWLDRLTPNSDSLQQVRQVGTSHIYREVSGSGNQMVAVARPTYLAPTHQTMATANFLVSTSADAWQFEWLDGDATPQVIGRVQRSPDALNDARWKAIVEAEIARALARDSTSDAEVTRNRMNPERPASLPAFSKIFATPNGNVWLLDYRTREQTGWAATAFDQDGRILGRIEEAVGDPPVAIGNDRMAFRTEDDLGIATITVRRIVMP